MAETRWFDALTAKAFCDAGKFVVFGYTLKPFSLTHSAQLTELESPLWIGEKTPEPEDLCIAAQICASETPICDFDPFVMPEDIGKEIETWLEYLRVCTARPMLRERTKNSIGGGLEAPFELMVAAYLLRKTGMSHREVWSLPFGLVYWHVEAIREQEDGDSMILTEAEAEELDRMNSPEEVAKRTEREARGVWIIQNIKDPVTRFDLLAKNERDELPENWKEATTNG